MLSLVPPPEDPARLGWPTTLPVELALHVDTPQNIFEANGLTKEDHARLSVDPAFIRAVQEAIEAVSKEGVSFRMKAKAQAELLLTKSWELIHASTDDVPATVKADLIKFTIKAAGLDASQEQKGKAMAAAMTALQINIHLE